MSYYLWQNTPPLCGGDECQPLAIRQLAESGGDNPDVSPISGRYSGFFRNTPQLCCGVGYYVGFYSSAGGYQSFDM